jgi:serine/threonine protein kinase
MSPLARLIQFLRTRPRRFGRYQIGELLGAGAMGEVHRAWDPEQQRWVALKTLPPQASSEQRARFEREATLSTRVRQPNAVRVLEQGTAADGTAFYTMDLVEGCTLRELVELEGPQTPARVQGWLIQLCAALEAVHGAGLVHRDVKPENVLITRVADGERVTLVDFGLVHELGTPVETQGEFDTLVGTPLYLSPEAITAPDRVGPKSDLYGLGALAYFLLTGEPVFQGADLIDVCCQHLYAEPRPISHGAQRGLGTELERAVLECLAKDPEARPQSAAALASRLKRCRTELATRDQNGALSLAA